MNTKLPGGIIICRTLLLYMLLLCNYKSGTLHYKEIMSESFFIIIILSEQKVMFTNVFFKLKIIIRFFLFQSDQPNFTNNLLTTWNVCMI